MSVHDGPEYAQMAVHIPQSRDQELPSRFHDQGILWNSELTSVADCRNPVSRDDDCCSWLCSGASCINDNNVFQDEVTCFLLPLRSLCPLRDRWALALLCNSEVRD